MTSVDTGTDHVIVDPSEVFDIRYNDNVANVIESGIDKLRTDYQRDDFYLNTTLEATPLFRYLIERLPVSIPRRGKEGELDLLVDPIAVLDAIDRRIRDKKALGSVLYEAAVKIPEYVMDHIFEAKPEYLDDSIQFRIDYTDDVSTLESLWSWVQPSIPSSGATLDSILSQYYDENDSQLRERSKQVVVLTVIAYMYYNNMYRKLGINDLTIYWSDMTKKERGTSRRSRRRRRRLVGTDEDDGGVGNEGEDWEEGPPPVYPPGGALPLDDAVLTVARSHAVTRKENFIRKVLGMIGAFVRFRVEMELRGMMDNEAWLDQAREEKERVLANYLHAVRDASMWPELRELLEKLEDTYSKAFMVVKLPETMKERQFLISSKLKSNSVYDRMKYLKDIVSF
jgi:hypothetical protein